MDYDYYYALGSNGKDHLLVLVCARSTKDAWHEVNEVLQEIEEFGKLDDILWRIPSKKVWRIKEVLEGW